MVYILLLCLLITCQPFTNCNENVTEDSNDSVVTKKSTVTHDTSSVTITANATPSAESPTSEQTSTIAQPPPPSTTTAEVPKLKHKGVKRRGSAETSIEKQLIKTLLDEYENRGKMGRPIAEQNETLTVKYGLSLIQILDLDERNQVLSTNVWATYAWEDVYLTWDPAEYGNITKVRVPSETVWQPDIKLYNYADERLEEKRNTLIVLSYDGSVQWVPQAIYKSSCSIDITYFPFDMQTCIMKFGSWTYDGSKINLELYFDNEEGFEKSDYIESNEWTIVSSSAKKNVIKYACCPGEPFLDITFTLSIRRQPVFYNYILILPCILLSSLTLVLFWLPPESPAKMQLGMNIFVAFFVLLLLLAESTPPAAASIPLIGAYYCLNMIMITLSTFLSVVVVNLYFHGSRTEVPTIIRKIMINVVARIFCMRSVVTDPAERKSGNHKKQSKMLNNDRVYGEQANDRLVYTEMIMINVVARIFCMRSVVTDPAERKSGNHKKQSKMLNNDRVYGEQANDRLVYTEMQPEDSNSCKLSQRQFAMNSNSSNEQVSNLQQELKNTAALESDIKEIKSFMKVMMNKNLKKEKAEKIAREWKLVALVLDRLFFFMYLVIILVSVFTVFDFVIFGADGRSSKE